MGSVVLSDISMAFGARQIMEKVNFSLSSKSRIALSGANGSGKSTLLKIIAGLNPPDNGSVFIEKNTRVSYLPQSGVSFSGGTVREEAERAYDEVIPLLAELKELEARLGEVTVETEETARLVDRHHYLHERVLKNDYYAREGAISRVLKGLGFKDEELDKKVQTFSGGWQMRIALARVLLEQPDILLLDEPTNYLDLEARNWLEGFLTEFSGGVLIVSHDRFFLDVTVTEVAEIYLRKVTVYKGNYTAYLEKRTQELAQARDAYERQQEEIEKIEGFIKKFRYNSSKAKLVQSRVKQLEKIELLEKPPGGQKIHFAFPPAPHSGQIALTLEGIGKEYGEKLVLNDVNLELMRGEKLVLVGPNGAGKSTLMGIVAGKTPQSRGTVKYGADVVTGYFCQDDIDSYISGKTILEEVEMDAPTELIPRLRGLLGAFLFSGDDVYKPLSVLSGGEKNRVALVKLLLHPSNLLLLDEPTNHLDLTSKDILLEALQSFQGALVFVSHDRYFIEKLATKVLEVDPETREIRVYPGDYSYYLWKKEQEKTGDSGYNVEKEKEKILSSGKLAREEEKRRKSELNRLQKEEKELVDRMEVLDQAYHSLEADMALEENYTDGEKIRQIKAKMSLNRKENEVLLARWEEVELSLEEYL